MTEDTRDGVLSQLRGAAMLNIRINFQVNLKKVGVVLLAYLLSISHLAAPAQALPAPVVSEKTVTVSLTYLNVTTTKAEATKAVTSSNVKYFDAETLAFLTVYSKGWTVPQWKCLRNIWKSESHFNPKARNMSSGAYGIAQFLPNTWGNYKVYKTSEAQLQIKYGLRYIQMRYGSKNDTTGACNAWNFHLRHGWY